MTIDTLVSEFREKFGGKELLVEIKNEHGNKSLVNVTKWAEDFLRTALHDYGEQCRKEGRDELSRDVNSILANRHVLHARTLPLNDK